MISVCSDFEAEIDYSSLVDLYHDLHFISSEIDALVYANILEKVSMLGTFDSGVFEQANAEAQRRILEPTNNIRHHVQVRHLASCIFCVFKFDKLGVFNFKMYSGNQIS